MVKRLLAALVVAGLLGFGQAAAQTSAQPVKVRIGIIGALLDAGNLIAIEKHYFEDEGIEPDVKTFATSADLHQALSIGALDVISNLPSVPLFMSHQRGIGLEIVASSGNQVPGHALIGIVLRRALVESGRYKSAADLKGMKLATGVTTPSHWFAVEVAKQAGIEESDIQFVSLGIANTIAAMENKAVDGGSVQEPFASLLREKADGVLVRSMDQVFPNFPAGYLIYGPLLAKTDIEAGKRYMVAFLRAMEDYRAAFGPEQKDRDGILAILKKYNVTILPSTPSLGLPADYKPSLDHVDAFLAWHVATGTIRAAPDMKPLVDDQFRLYALDKLKLAKGP